MTDKRAFDVREDIVLCRDCVWFGLSRNGLNQVCWYWDDDVPNIVKPDGFCAWGERKGDD